MMWLIKKYVKDRNEMLKKCDVNELRRFVNSHAAFYEKDFVEAINKASDEMLTIVLHKMIVNVPKLPKSLRVKSALWLALNGYDLTLT